MLGFIIIEGNLIINQYFHIIQMTTTYVKHCMVALFYHMHAIKLCVRFAAF